MGFTKFVPDKSNQSLKSLEETTDSNSLNFTEKQIF